jgi:hypothetical protein
VGPVGTANDLGAILGHDPADGRFGSPFFSAMPSQVRSEVSGLDALRDYFALAHYAIT